MRSVATVDLRPYDLTEWTAIAVQPRGRWEPVDGAPVTPRQARELHDAGRLLMSQRRAETGIMELVIMAPKEG